MNSRPFTMAVPVSRTELNDGVPVFPVHEKPLDLHLCGNARSMIDSQETEWLEDTFPELVVEIMREEAEA
ncbi:hypothetical protein QC761_0112130 [Podospora bellae-mahoneyi]|uniref:Uncharacterized protein n=1 Tax=Podospora bellae-mahoneyi TaxID=2093777 RepID=A0ABR0F927_9PEZI|nr:hypothetical protein QC761_0112130 [Podospora bellae-mahoneyi]